MIQLRRCLLLAAPLAVVVLLGALPGRAQQSTPPRYAFADTTLLRDTLDLQFTDLFRLADSLGVLPDSLRALSVRYHYSLERLVALADSLRIPVDSVGVRMERERYNPLAVSVQRLTTFHYASSYNVARTSSSWVNGSDFNYILGPLFVRNTTSITMDRFRAGGRRASLRQTRSSATESGWKFSPQLSIGGRANLDRFDSVNPGSLNNESENKNEFQLSLRSRQQPSSAMSSEINLFTGYLGLSNTRQVKRGLSNEVSGSFHVSPGSWFSHDLDGQLSGNIAGTRVPGAIQRLNTRDLAANLRGTLGLFSTEPVSMNINYALRSSRVQTPADSQRVEDVRTGDGSLVGSLRLRQDNSRYLNLTGNLDHTRQATALALTSQSSRDGTGFLADGSYELAGWALTSRYNQNHNVSRFPQRDTTGGYAERGTYRSIEGTVTRNLWQRVTAKASGGVTLASYRYSLIGGYTNPPVPRDQYHQFYRLEGIYSQPTGFSTGVALEVVRDLFVNIPSASTAANTETRSYRAEWRWSYQLLSGLTATQRNTLGADYALYPFLPSNNRLSLDYNTLTTLNAVITPRLRLDMTHNARRQPSGNYSNLPDGLPYFSRSDEGVNYTLSTQISYSPTPALSLNLLTEYISADRRSALNGQLTPQRLTQTLNFSGGARLNVPLMTKGRLTGDIRRTYSDNQSTGFSQGVAQPTPASGFDYWNGRLELSWDL